MNDGSMCKSNEQNNMLNLRQEAKILCKNISVPVVFDLSQGHLHARLPNLQQPQHWYFLKSKAHNLIS